MKFVLFLIIIISYKAYSQDYKPPIPPFATRGLPSGVVDSGNIRIYYALNAEDIYNPETYVDFQCLEIGTNLSKYYSYFVYYADSVSADWRKKNPNSKGGIRGWSPKGKQKTWIEYQWSEYFKNSLENLFTEYTRLPSYMEKHDCRCSENIPVQNWELQEDTLTITGYLCQKATCRFRGRDYTAWFAPDIPINNGPWKFGGLPGLILKVYDNDKLWIFECTAIQNHQKKFLIKAHNAYKQFPNIERTKLLKFYNNIHADYLKMSGLILLDKGKHEYKKNTHQPLELE